MKPLLCLDFDGVCHSYTSPWTNVWTIPDPPVAGLFEFLQEAFKQFRVAIHSSRSEAVEGRDAMRDWFVANAIEHFMYHADVKFSPREDALLLVAKLEFPIYKPKAMVTLDDRAVTFKGYWPDIGMLRGFVAWNDYLKAKKNESAS